MRSRRETQGPSLKGHAMHANSYVGIVEPEVTRLIISRARRLRIAGDEIDDLQQQIVPKLAEFEFDASRSNGATPMTAMTSVIDNQLKTHLRAKRRYQSRIEHMKSKSRALASGRPVWPNHVTQPEPVDLRMDLADAMGELSQRDRVVCDGLSKGQTIKAIAERLGCGRDTVNRAIVRIRNIFTAAGLKAWIDPDYRAEPGQA
ncbi:MAG: sigma-70 family RNA polymerase sigma factor [Phycisphaera sp.]|nr:sigma-70 family RNA polymerase sigma factor [Phycisphaera sp.]